MKEKHKRVAQEYVRNGYKKQVAYMAVYTDSKPKAAATSFYELLKNPEFSAYVDELKNGAELAAKEALNLTWIGQAKELKKLQDLGVEARKLAMKILRKEDKAGDMERLTFLAKTYGVSYAATTKTIVSMNQLLGFNEKRPEVGKGPVNIQVNMIKPPFEKTTNAEWREAD